jgi:hypothetical protein
MTSPCSPTTASGPRGSSWAGTTSTSTASSTTAPHRPRDLDHHRRPGVEGPRGEVPGDPERRCRWLGHVPDVRSPARLPGGPMAAVRDRPAPGRQHAGGVGDPVLRRLPVVVDLPVAAARDLPERRLLPHHRGPAQDHHLHDAALAGARPHRVHVVRPVHARPDGGDPPRGLHTDRLGQGRAHVAGAVQALPTRGDRARGHDLRSRLRLPAGRRDLRRADLQHRRDRVLGGCVLCRPPSTSTWSARRCSSRRSWSRSPTCWWTSSTGSSTRG